MILNIDAENKRISLGLKQAAEDPWLKIGENYPVGMDLKGKVVRLMDKGVVVDLGDDLEGFIPISQVHPEGKAIQSVTEVVYEGMNLEMKVMEVDPIHRRIVLGVTNIPEDQPPRPAEPSKVESMDALEAPVPIPAGNYDIEDTE